MPPKKKEKAAPKKDKKGKDDKKGGKASAMSAASEPKEIEKPKPSGLLSQAAQDLLKANLQKTAGDDAKLMAAAREAAREIEDSVMDLLDGNVV